MIKGAKSPPLSFRMFLVRVGFKEFYVRPADSRGALTPSNVHWTFSVRLSRFTYAAGKRQK